MSRKPGGRRFNVGRLATATDPGTLRDAIAELLATAIFIFAAEGATRSLGGDNKCMTGVALAHALALAAVVASTLNISGGHVNPAITFGALLGGHVCLVRSMVYWTAQLLGAATAAFLLRFTATGGAVRTCLLTSQAGDTIVGVLLTTCERMQHLADEPALGVVGFHAVVVEAAMAFGLMYAYYATAIDPRPRKSGGGLAAVSMAAPLAVGLLAGANVLAFHGAVMNPAWALVGSSRRSLSMWAGPLIGAGLAGLVYEHIVLNPAIHMPSATSA
jgi:aquaporin TIP